MSDHRNHLNREQSESFHEDPRLDKAIRILRELPAKDPVVVAHIIASARTQRGPDLIPNALGTRHKSLRWRGIGASLAAVFVFGTGFVVGNIKRFGMMEDGRGAYQSDASGLSDQTAITINETDALTYNGLDAGLVHSQVSSFGDEYSDYSSVEITFSIEAPAASNVAVVGDFNSWNPSATPLLRRNDKTGDWTGTIPLTPGRHTYAFMVDGHIMPDPKAVNVRDPDYDVIVSTIVVNEGDL